MCFDELLKDHSMLLTGPGAASTIFTEGGQERLQSGALCVDAWQRPGVLVPADFCLCRAPDIPAQSAHRCRSLDRGQYS